MLLRRLHLLTAELPAVAAFYADALACTVIERTAERLALRLGRTELVFSTAPVGTAPTYHFAFNVPADSLPAATDWLRARAPLLPYEGRDIIDFPNWRARSVYALDPAGNIIECIGREAVPLPAAGQPFGPADLHGVSEIGVVVPDVASFLADCRTQYGLPLFARQPPAPRFAAVGDDFGLLIVVPVGRPWFPTADRFSTASPLAIELEAESGRMISLRL